MKEVELLKPNNLTEEYLNWLYQTYVLANDRCLDENGLDMKYHLRYVIDYLLEHKALDKDRMYVEQTSLEKRVEVLEQEVNMLKCNSNRPTYSYGVR